MAGISTKAINKLEQNKYGYNGKELQSKEFANGDGLEWYDYGARMYDQQIGRYFTQDRFADLLSDNAPYNYCKNDPIKFLDLNGDILILSSIMDEDRANIAYNKLIRIIERGLGGRYKVERNSKTGEVSLTETGKEGEMSSEQKALYGILNSLIESDTQYEQYVFDNSSAVHIGTWGGIGPGSIDVGDMEKFPADGPSTAQGNLAHELYENKLRTDEVINSPEKFNPTKSFGPAHEKAISKAENLVNGSKRIDQALPSSKYSYSGRAINGNWDEIYIQNGIKYVVSVNYVNGNVSNVKITPAEGNKNKSKK